MIHRIGMRPRRPRRLEERGPTSTSGALYVDVRAVAKRNSPVSPYCVANEYVAAEIAKLLQIPISPCGILEDEAGTRWYAELAFSKEGEPVEAADPLVCVECFPDLCAGITLFDIYIANGDRHSRNIFLDEPNKDIRVFDHELALLGGTAGQGEGRLTGTVVDSPAVGEHCILPALSKDSRYQSEWIAKIRELRDSDLDAMCRRAGIFGLTELEIDALAGFLKERRGRLPGLIARL
jgi:hypothetical protein